MKDEVVKIDAELMREIEKLISKNKFIYTSKKQVVNLAIIEFLNSRSFILQERKVLDSAQKFAFLTKKNQNMFIKNSSNKSGKKQQSFANPIRYKKRRK